MQSKMVQLCSAVILCLSLFGQSVIAKPGYAAGYDVDYYVSWDRSLIVWVDLFNLFYSIHIDLLIAYIDYLFVCFLRNSKERKNENKISGGKELARMLSKNCEYLCNCIDDANVCGCLGAFVGIRRQQHKIVWVFAAFEWYWQLLDSNAVTAFVGVLLPQSNQIKLKKTKFCFATTLRHLKNQYNSKWKLYICIVFECTVYMHLNVGTIFDQLYPISN